MGFEIGGGIQETSTSKQARTLKEFKDKNYVGLLRTISSEEGCSGYDVVYINCVGQCFLVWSFGEAKLLVLFMGINSGWPEWECEPFYGNVNISLTSEEE